MRLTPVMQRYIVHWGEMGSRWGMNRSVAQIHALLYLAAEGLHAPALASVVGLAVCVSATGAAQAAVVFDGSHYIVVTANWRAGLWRYVE